VRARRGQGRQRAGREGTSLFELVLVIVLIGVGIVPILATFREAAQRSPLSELQTRAAFLAAERMEEIIADRLSAARGYTWITAANYPVETSIAGFPGFTRTTTIGVDQVVDGVTVRPVAVAVANAAIPAVTLDTWFVEAAP
jgi:Tfp pilus assembly protein PilV